MSKFKKAWINEDTGEIHSPKSRMVYPALLEAKVNRKFPNNPPKFNVNLLIPKDCDIEAISEEIQRAAAEKHGTKWKTKKLKLPLKKTADNDKLAELAEEYPWVLTATSNKDFPPVVFGPDAKPFKGDSSDIYGGRWAIVAGSAWGYDTGSDGVGWNLSRVQLLDHDDPIGGGRNATASGFEAVGEPDAGSDKPAGKAASVDDLFS